MLEQERATGANQSAACLKQGGVFQAARSWTALKCQDTSQGMATRQLATHENSLDQETEY